MPHFLVGLVSLLLINFTLAFNYETFLAKVKDSSGGIVTEAKYLSPDMEGGKEITAWQAEHKAAFEKYITKDLKQKTLLGTPQKYIIAFIGSENTFVAKINGAAASFVDIPACTEIGASKKDDINPDLITKLLEGILETDVCAMKASCVVFLLNAIQYGYPALKSLSDTPPLVGGEKALALINQIDAAAKSLMMTKLYVLKSGPPKFLASFVETLPKVSNKDTYFIAGNSKLTLYVGGKKIAATTCSKHSEKSRQELYIKEDQEDANGLKFAAEITALCALEKATGKCQGNQAGSKRILYIGGKIGADAKAAGTDAQYFFSAESEYNNYYPQQHHNRYDRYMNRLKKK